MTASRTFRMLAGAALMSALLMGCGDTDDSSTTETSETPPSEATESATSEPAPDTDSGLGRDADLRTDELPVTPEAAIDTATNEVGDGGILHSVEVDWSDRHSTWKWEVQILKDGTDHEVEIDANTGDVITHEKDRTNDTEKAIDLNDPLTFADALRLATDRVDGRLAGWKLEWDDGRAEYQFDLVDPSRTDDDETEVTVDVETQKVTVD